MLFILPYLGHVGRLHFPASFAYRLGPRDYKLANEVWAEIIECHFLATGVAILEIRDQAYMEWQDRGGRANA